MKKSLMIALAVTMLPLASHAQSRNDRLERREGRGHNNGARPPSNGGGNDRRDENRRRPEPTPAPAPKPTPPAENRRDNHGRRDDNNRGPSNPPSHSRPDSPRDRVDRRIDRMRDRPNFGRRPDYRRPDYRRDERSYRDHVSRRNEFWGRRHDPRYRHDFRMRRDVRLNRWRSNYSVWRPHIHLWWNSYLLTDHYRYYGLNARLAGYTMLSDSEMDFDTVDIFGAISASYVKLVAMRDSGYVQTLYVQYCDGSQRSFNISEDIDEDETSSFWIDVRRSTFFGGSACITKFSVLGVGDNWDNDETLIGLIYR